MNEMFKKECEELGISFDEFPYDFAEGHRPHYPTYFAAMMWVLKKRQDKMLDELQHPLIVTENEVIGKV